MTREEAIDNNKNLRMYMRLSDKNQPYKFLEENYIALDMAIKALEHPEKNVVSIVPCGNAISRYDAIHLADELKQDLPDDEHLTDMVMAHNEGVSEYQSQLSLLPSVTPQPKTGQYEKHIDHTDCIWYGNDSGCPVTCSQYRDGWNDAMDYIFKNGKGYQPYRHDV